MFMIGVISILPWDSTLTLSAYWMEKFRKEIYHLQNDTTTRSSSFNVILSPLQKQFQSYISIAICTGSTPTMVAHLFLGHLNSVKTKSFASLVNI